MLGGRSGLSDGPHTAVFTNIGSGSYIDLDSILFETQNGSTAQDQRDNTTQGHTRRQPSKRLNVAVIGGGIAGIVMLLLLIILAILIFRRRHPQERSLSRKITIRQPKTPNLPLQPPPMPSISLPNPFSDPSDLEKVAPYSVPLGPNENPFTDDARVKLPWVPETCVTRDSYYDWSDHLQVQSGAVRLVSLRS